VKFYGDFSPQDLGKLELGKLDLGKLDLGKLERCKNAESDLSLSLNLQQPCPCLIESIIPTHRRSRI
jgi:hypothetical protein